MPVMWSHQRAWELLLGVILATVLISFYNTRKIDNENLALGNQNVSALEKWQGHYFTAYSPPTIKKLVEDLPVKSESAYWLWLGNSQLHAINQRQEEDHLAPYWLRREFQCAECLVPLGISVPNANFQEFLLLSRYVQQKVKISHLILELPFVSMREDGIRNELADFDSVQLRADLSATAAGAGLVELIEKSLDKGHAAGAMGNSAESERDFQTYTENWLENQMADSWPIWKARGSLKAYFLIDLYYARNWFLNIKPNTVRKSIGARYDRNMIALEDILQRAKREAVPILVYIAPIRQDLPPPYDIAEYEQWKINVEKMVNQNGGQFLNMEKLVPANYWGSYHEDDVDFMHFQGMGHQLVAQEIARKIIH